LGPGVHSAIQCALTTRTRVCSLLSFIMQSENAVAMKEGALNPSIDERQKFHNHSHLGSDGRVTVGPVGFLRYTSLQRQATGLMRDEVDRGRWGQG